MTRTTRMGQTIGAIARDAGVHVETVRYYERIGLLPRPPRAAGSLRRYPPEAARRVRFIKRAQWLGFSLEEVALLLGLAENGRCCDTRALGEMKLGLLRRRLEELGATKRVLESLLSRCSDPSSARCPLIDALLGENELAAQLTAPPAGMALAKLEAENAVHPHTIEPTLEKE